MEFNHLNTDSQRTPWNKGRIVGQKAPLKLKEIWAIRFRLQDSERLRELALFNLAIDSKLRGCDLVRLKGQRRGTRRSGLIPRHCGAAQDRSTRSIRDHRADSRQYRHVDDESAASSR